MTTVRIFIIIYNTYNFTIISTSTIIDNKTRLMMNVILIYSSLYLQKSNETPSFMQIGTNWADQADAEEKEQQQQNSTKAHDDDDGMSKGGRIQYLAYFINHWYHSQNSMSSSRTLHQPVPVPSMYYYNNSNNNNNTLINQLHMKIAGPPPGFENTSIDATAAALSSIAVSTGNNNVDTPDLSLKSDKLVDEGPGEIKTVTAADTMYTSAKSFEDLGLSQELLQGLYTEMKFERPSRIQAQTLPMILTPPHKSLIAQAHNGSGKTTCFTLAMLSRVDPGVKAPQALCVCPTRELVTQNLSVLERMGKFSGIAATSTAESSVTATRRAKIEDHVVIGTHGKLRDWINKRILNTKNLRILVFDEADEMLKQDGFADDSVRLIKQLRAAVPDIQILLFSATFNEEVKRFATKVVPGANQVFIPKEDLSLDVIKQYRVICPTPHDKVKVLSDMIFPQCEKLGQTIIFVRTRETARALHAAV